jgi:hypothetical protein
MAQKGASAPGETENEERNRGRKGIGEMEERGHGWWLVARRGEEGRGGTRLHIYIYIYIRIYKNMC